MSPKRRELMHRAMDGVTDLSGAMFILHHYKFCDNILIWLISHRYTGKNLSELLIKKFRSSVPSLVDFVIAAANARNINNERIAKTD
jgi:hypothetical protein